MTRKRIIILFICMIILITICYRVLSAFELVAKNERVSEPEINKVLIKESFKDIKHFNSEKNENSSIYSIYNINDYDYGLIVTSFKTKTGESLNEIVSIVNKSPYDRFDYGQGSIFKTDFFYRYYPESTIKKIDIRSNRADELIIDRSRKNVWYMKTSVTEDLGISIDDDKKSFILCENKVFTDTSIIEICLAKKGHILYLIVLKSINKHSGSKSQIRMSEIIDFNHLADS